MDCTVLLPCLNEEANIACVTDEIAAWIAGRGLNGEILVIDNGSSDRSAEVAEAHGAKVVREMRRGYGHALRRGFAEAKGEIIIKE